MALGSLHSPENLGAVPWAVTSRCPHGAQGLAGSAGVGGQDARWAGAGEGLELSGDARSTEIVSCGDNLRVLLEP